MHSRDILWRKYSEASKKLSLLYWRKDTIHNTMETIKRSQLNFLRGASIEDGGNKKIRVYAFNIILCHFTARVARLSRKNHKTKHHKWENLELFDVLVNFTLQVILVLRCDPREIWENFFHGKETSYDIFLRPIETPNRVLSRLLLPEYCNKMSMKFTIIINVVFLPLIKFIFRCLHWVIIKYVPCIASKIHSSSCWFKKGQRYFYFVSDFLRANEWIKLFLLNFNFLNVNREWYSQWIGWSDLIHCRKYPSPITNKTDSLFFYSVI